MTPERFEVYNKCPTAILDKRDLVVYEVNTLPPKTCSPDENHQVISFVELIVEVLNRCNKPLHVLTPEEKADIKACIGGPDQSALAKQIEE